MDIDIALAPHLSPLFPPLVALNLYHFFFLSAGGPLGKNRSGSMIRRRCTDSARRLKLLRYLALEVATTTPMAIGVELAPHIYPLYFMLVVLHLYPILFTLADNPLIIVQDQ